MAEELGAAVLRLEVDDAKARRSVDRLRDAIENFKPKFSGVERALQNIATQADTAAARVQTLNQVLSQAPGASFSKITAQIKRLTKESLDLKIQSDAYLKTLERISELEFVRNARAGRQRAAADFGAATGAVLTSGYGASDRLPKLPSTIAGDLQRLRELNFLVRNLTVGSAAFEVAQRELEAVQRRVAQATNGTSESFRKQEQAAAATERRLEKLAQLQQYYADQNKRAGGFRDPNTGAMIARGSNTTADERAYRGALRAAEDLLAVDLKRLQLLRQFQQQLARTTAARESSQLSGFAAFSAGASDPVQKSIARNARKRLEREERRTAQFDVLDADLARQREARVASEKRALQVQRQREASARKAAQQEETEARQRLEEARRRRNDVISNALIGGAFPLLFGQGLGASVGGAVGGGLGGAVGGQFGFGLSLVGTAVGAQFDAITQKSVVLGAALNDPIGRFSELQQNALLSSRSLEKQVEALISVGREAEAAALIQQDLARSYGGAAAARELAAAQDELGRSWTALSVNVAQISLPPIAGAASSAADALTVLLEPLRQIRAISAGAGGAGGPAPAPTATGQVAGALREGARGLVPTIPGLPLGLPIVQGFLSQAANLIQAPEPTAGAAGTRQEEKRTKLLEAQKKLITEQIRGRASLVKQAELEVLEIEQQIKLDAIRATTTDKKAQAIQIDAAQREFELRRFELGAQKDDAVRREAVDRAALAARAERADRERTAAATILRAQQEATADALARQLSNAQELATAGASSARSAIAQRQAVLETVAAAQGRFQQASAEYDAARIVGDEPAIDAALARQRQAAGEIQLSIVTGAETFARTIEQARNNIRSTLEGSYRLLRPEIQQKLLADARQRIDYTLFNRGRVRSPSDVFAAASASESISQQRAIISESSQGFAQLSAQLGEGSPVVRALTDLNNKDWLVQVNVAADGTSSSYGDVVAGAIQ